MDNYLRSDCILREILEDRKSLPGFLDAVFGFLSRNTDFYHIQNTINDKVGFPRGVKEQILMSCMQKYEQPNLSCVVGEGPSIVAEEVEVVSEESTKSLMNTFQEPVSENVMETEEICSTNTTKFNISEHKNGSVFEKYCWSQTVKDIELCVLLPKEVKSAKHIKLDFQPEYITIKTLLPKEEYLICGGTWDKYKNKDVIWSISDGKLIISLDKRKERWWDKLFLNEAPIDNKSVDTEEFNCIIND